MGELQKRIIKDLEVRRDRVLNGGINCIPLPFARFRQDWPGIEQGTYYLISAATKGAKTQFTFYVFVINVIIWTYKHPGIIKPRIFYFPLEETKEAITLRFMAFLISYLTRGKIIISPQDLKSTNEEKPLSQEVIDIMNSEEFTKLMDYYEEVVIFYDNKNVTGINKVMCDYAKAHGETTYREVRIAKTDELTLEKTYETLKIFDRYIPNDPSEYIICIVDHVSLLHPEKGTDLRESICKLSSNCVELRNKYNYIPVIVQQQSTETTNLDAFKENKIRPTVAGLADSKYTARDCSMMIGLCNPWSFEKKSYLEYNLTKFKGNLRFMEVVLNRNGVANGICPLLFRGEINGFKEAPPPNDTVKLNEELEKLHNNYIGGNSFSLLAWAHNLFIKSTN